MIKLSILEKAEKIIAKAIQLATKREKYALEEIQLVSGYSESGYNGKVVALANWNNTGILGSIDVSALLEKVGVNIEWYDEWVVCGYCNKAVRIQPDSYSWKRSFTIDEDGITCLECVDPVEHLESLEGNPLSCNTFSRINPFDYGYVLVKSGFENGFHPGQTDNPKEIAKKFETLGITRYLFNLDQVGQFDIQFSIWIHESESNLCGTG